MKTKKVQTVLWLDACTHSGVTFKECLEDEPEIVETYGIVVHNDKKYVIIMTHNFNGEYNDYLKIPKSLVRKIC